MGNHNEKLFAALLGGAIVGAAIAVMFAPSKGTDLRDKISSKAGNLKDVVSDKIQEVSSLLDNIHGIINEVKTR